MDTNFITEGNWFLEITLNIVLDADPKVNYLGYNAEEQIRVPLNLSSEFRKDYVVEMGEALYHLLTYEYILPFSKLLGVAPKGATVTVSFPHLVLSCNGSNPERRKILSRAVV